MDTKVQMCDVCLFNHEYNDAPLNQAIVRTVFNGVCLCEEHWDKYWTIEEADELLDGESAWTYKLRTHAIADRKAMDVTYRTYNDVDLTAG